MATTLRQELIKLALVEKEDKNIAKILAYHYSKLDLSDRKKLFESLMYYYRMPVDFDFEELQKKTAEENNTENYRNKDFRIKSIEIANLRGIPEQKDYPFGINFVKNSSVNNAIILANNGTGKSSVFAGLEMIFAQEIGEKKLRTFNSDNLESKDFDKYLDRIQTNTKPKCEIETNEGNFNLANVVFKRNELKLFNPSNHFISDYDIYHYGKIEYSGSADNDKSFHYLLAKTLGLGDFLKFESILGEIANYSRTTESRQLRSIETDLKDCNKNIDSWSNQLKERIEILDKLKKDIQKTSFDNPNKNSLNLINTLLNKDITIEISVDDYKRSLDTLLSGFQEFQKQESNENLSLEKDFLEIGMSLLNNYDNCPFCQNSNKTHDEIYSNTRIRFELLRKLLIDKDELIQSYKIAIEQINNFFLQTTYLYNQVSEERVLLGTYKDLDELFKLEERIYLQNSPLLADEELIEHVTVLNTKYPNNDDIYKLFRFIAENKNLIYDFALESIEHNKQFITQRKRILGELSKNLSSAETVISVDKQIGVIEDEINRLNKQIKDTQNRAEVLNKEIIQVKESVDLVQRIKSETKELLPKYKLTASNLVQEAFDPIKNMISAIMSDFLKDDKDITLSIETKETRKTIEGEEKVESLIVASIQYIDTATGELKTVSPSHYFNTFRYKLFSLMVSLSLALSTRKKYGINLPLVMDDLFYASDFVSKHRFSKFISKVIELFYKYTPELPLQFILFTHDDIIFRNAIDALNRNAIAIDMENINEENRQPLLKKTIIARFFNPSDKDEKPETFGNNQLYWDLLYKLPKEIMEIN